MTKGSRQSGYFKTIIKSFYSGQAYRDVALHWSGEIIVYLILVVAISWGLLTIGIQKQVNIVYGVVASKYLPQVPELSIKNGELKTPEDRPYLITDEDNKSVVAIIDTSGKYKSLENSHAGFLLTKNALFYQSDSKLGKSHQFDSDLNLEIHPVQINKTLDVFIKWSWLLFFPILVLGSLLYRIIEAALYAIIGEIFAHIVRAPLTYGQLFKLSILAMTPAILVSTVLDWFSFSFNHLWLFYFVLSMVYLFFGIRACKKI